MAIFAVTLFCLAVITLPLFNYYHFKRSLVKTNTWYKSKYSGVVFQELYRYENESVMLRTDINLKLLVAHKELDKNFTKVEV